MLPTNIQLTKKMYFTFILTVIEIPTVSIMLFKNILITFHDGAFVLVHIIYFFNTFHDVAFVLVHVIYVFNKIFNVH